MIDRKFWIGLRFAVGGVVQGIGVDAFGAGSAALGALILCVGGGLIVWGYVALDDFVELGGVR